MRSNIKRNMTKQSGFTLIELMIVVAIVAILAAIAMPAYQNYTKKAKMTELVAATGAVKTAVEVCIQSGTGCLTSDTNFVTKGNVQIKYTSGTSAAPFTIEVKPASGQLSPLTTNDIYKLSASMPSSTSDPILWDGTCDLDGADDKAYCP